MDLAMAGQRSAGQLGWFTFLLSTNLRLVLFSFFYSTIVLSARSSTKFLVPCMVHQIYDYHAPNFYLYLSLMAVQQYVRPQRHILWVNDEGRFRKYHWEHWQMEAIHNHPTSWEANLTALIRTHRIEVRLITFPQYAPGNTTYKVFNLAHRSDFLRMNVLLTMGGVYFDTDAFPFDSLTELRQYNFSIGYDQIHIYGDLLRSPKKLNNGVIVAAPNNSFMRKWESHYSDFDPLIWDYHSCQLPYKLAMANPHLVHVETNKLGPLAFGITTPITAAALTCGILVRTQNNTENIITNRNNGTCENSPGWIGLVGRTTFDAIWHPRWIKRTREWTFEDTQPDKEMFTALSKRMVLHLTMKEVPGNQFNSPLLVTSYLSTHELALAFRSNLSGICMIHKNLRGPEDLQKLPSLLDSIFRVALFGKDSFDYAGLLNHPTKQQRQNGTTDLKLHAWNGCRAHLGMTELSWIMRQRDIEIRMKKEKLNGQRHWASLEEETWTLR